MNRSQDINCKVCDPFDCDKLCHNCVYYYPEFSQTISAAKTFHFVEIFHGSKDTEMYVLKN